MVLQHRSSNNRNWYAYALYWKEMKILSGVLSSGIDRPCLILSCCLACPFYFWPHSPLGTFSKRPCWIYIPYTLLNWKDSYLDTSFRCKSWLFQARELILHWGESMGPHPKQWAYCSAAKLGSPCSFRQIVEASFLQCHPPFSRLASQETVCRTIAVPCSAPYQKATAPVLIWDLLQAYELDSRDTKTCRKPLEYTDQLCIVSFGRNHFYYVRLAYTGIGI